MKLHSFNGIEFQATAPFRPVELTELESAERALGCRFPSEYRDFVLRFGTGEFIQLGLRALSPSRIVQTTPEDRARLSEYWFWEDSPKVWTQKQAIESVACFDGNSGDDIRFHPAEPQTMYLLPHEDTIICKFTTLAGIVRFFRGQREAKLETLTFVPDGKHA